MWNGFLPGVAEAALDYPLPTGDDVAHVTQVTEPRLLQPSGEEWAEEAHQPRGQQDRGQV